MVEKNLRLLVNVLAAIIYAVIIYICFFDDTYDSMGQAFMVFIILGLVVLVVQKVLGSILGTMGSAFDGTVGEIGKKNE